MIYIAPSLLAADFTRLGEDTARVEAAGADFLHLDVMDGVFVPNISFGPAVIGALRPQSKLVFDVHLMITAPERYVDRFIKAGADIISFHLEACEDPAALIKTIKAAGVKAAVAISPDTPAEAIIPYLADVDMALIMTVYPGFGGQKFMPEVLDKVRNIRAHEHGKKHYVRVATSDRLEQVIITGQGCHMVSAGEFEQEVKTLEEMIRNEYLDKKL